MGVNADVLTALAAILALPISLFAAYLSNRADARSKVAARTQVYLALRERFFHVHSQLPEAYSDPSWYPELKSDRAAATRYWHHAFDEWYVTTRLDPALLRDLWMQYFKGAISSGLRHKGLRIHLLESIAARGEHDDLWMAYVNEVAIIWAQSHPQSSGACLGLACDHTLAA
jgi:hypothetical protein